MNAFDFWLHLNFDIFDITLAKIKSWSVVVEFIFDIAYEEIGVTRSHFGSHCYTVDLFVVVVA